MKKENENVEIVWEQNNCKVDGAPWGRIILSGDRWRAERTIRDFTLTVAWKSTAKEAMAALERCAKHALPLEVTF